MSHREPFTIGGVEVGPGSRRRVDLSVPDSVIGTSVTLPVRVLHGRRPGPRLFVCAAVHGDELNGIEIVRRLLSRAALRRLRGTLVAVPVVNVYGAVLNSRYLPDRRDLNRSFPGHGKGSLTARLADLFMSEVVERCTHGVDLHTGAIHRTNLPQIRANLDDPATAAMASAFGAPVMLNASLREGSLRAACAELGVPVLLYEGGEALRFDEYAIRMGLNGVLQVMRHLEMLPRSSSRAGALPQLATSSSWVRAPDSGIYRPNVKLGARVDAGDLLGEIVQPLGGAKRLEAGFPGVVIGSSCIPLVHEGDALLHVARFDDHHRAHEQVEAFQDRFDSDPPHLDDLGPGEG